MQPDNSDEQAQSKPADTNLATKKLKNENVQAAHEQAEADIEKDTDLNGEPDPTADLDEGELAALDNNNDDNPMA